jgi:hypothetical protein
MKNDSNVDKKEMELRRDKDFIASLDMIGEGAPIYEAENEETVVRKSVNKSEESH